MEVRAFGIGVSLIESGDFATSFAANRRMTRESIAASPYYESAVRAIATMAREEQANRDLTAVAKAVETILECPRPALRYPRANAVQRAFNAVRRPVPTPAHRRILDPQYVWPVAGGDHSNARSFT